MLPTLSRAGLRGDWREGERRLDPLHKVVASWWEEELERHLEGRAFASDEDEWTYKQRLAARFDLDRFWTAQPRMCPIYRNGVQYLVAADDVRAARSLWFVSPGAWVVASGSEASREYSREVDGDCLFYQDASRMDYDYCGRLFSGREMVGLRVLEKGAYVCTEWRRTAASVTTEIAGLSETLCQGVFAVALPESDVFAAYVASGRQSYYWIALNSANDLASWCIDMVTRKWSQSDAPLDGNAAARLGQRVMKLCSRSYSPNDEMLAFNQFLDRWSKQEDLPGHLAVPESRLGVDVKPFLSGERVSYSFRHRDVKSRVP
jgi:hypothetical protein